jgi:hypothetical protein
MFHTKSKFLKEALLLFLKEHSVLQCWIDRSFQKYKYFSPPVDGIIHREFPVRHPLRVIRISRKFVVFLDILGVADDHGVRLFYTQPKKEVYWMDGVRLECIDSLSHHAQKEFLKARGQWTH